jgi:hypothetical protein
VIISNPEGGSHEDALKLAAGLKAALVHINIAKS